MMGCRGRSATYLQGSEGRLGGIFTGEVYEGAGPAVQDTEGMNGTKPARTEELATTGMTPGHSEDPPLHHSHCEL